MVGGLGWHLAFGQRVPVIDPKAEPRPVVARHDLGSGEQSTIELFENVSPSVVYITTHAVRYDLFSLQPFKIPQGTGSGFVWNEKGYIVTNFHVIQNARGAEVTLSDQSVWEASLVGAAADKDLAVLKIEAPAEKLHPIDLGKSSNLKVGQQVLAIGNPFGFDHTLTTGVIGGLGRSTEAPDGSLIKDLIQTDAAINPGNSGGPLLDSAGLLIGVNTAIYSPSGAYAGIGLAIPVDTVNNIVPQLIRHGKLIRPGFGIQVVPERIARRFITEGVLVQYVQPGSAADEAGMLSTTVTSRGRVRQLGDVILAIEGKPTTNFQELQDALEDHKVGETVRVKVWREHEKKAIELSVELEAID